MRLSTRCHKPQRRGGRRRAPRPPRVERLRRGAGSWGPQRSSAWRIDERRNRPGGHARASASTKVRSESRRPSLGAPARFRDGGGHRGPPGTRRGRLGDHGGGRAAALDVSWPGLARARADGPVEEPGDVRGEHAVHVGDEALVELGEAADVRDLQQPRAEVVDVGEVAEREAVLVRAEREVAPAWGSHLPPDFNARVIERLAPASFAVLRELDESSRFVQRPAESTSTRPGERALAFGRGVASRRSISARSGAGGRRGAAPARRPGRRAAASGSAGGG